MKKEQLNERDIEKGMEEFANRLRSVFQKSGFKQEEIGWICKIKQPHINRILKNPSVISVKTLIKLTLAIGCNVELPKRKARFTAPNRRKINMAAGRKSKGKKKNQHNRAMLRWHRSKVKKHRPFEDL